MRILSVRLRALMRKVVRLTIRHFLAGFGYTTGTWVAAEILGHATTGQPDHLSVRVSKPRF
jgi:hypothetical protein